MIKSNVSISSSAPKGLTLHINTNVACDIWSYFLNPKGHKIGIVVERSTRTIKFSRYDSELIMVRGLSLDFVNSFNELDFQRKTIFPSRVDDEITVDVQLRGICFKENERKLADALFLENPVQFEPLFRSSEKGMMHCCEMMERTAETAK